MRRLIVAGLLSCFVFLFCAAIVSAAVPDDPYSISFGGVWAFRITQDAGGLTAKQRVTEITKRIVDQILDRYRVGQDLPMTITSLGPNAEIYIGDVPLITVTPADAKGSSLTPLKLAVQWAVRLHEGLVRALPADQPYI